MWWNPFSKKDNMPKMSNGAPIKAGVLRLKAGDLITLDGYWMKIIAVQPGQRLVIMKALTPAELIAEEKAQKILNKAMSDAVEKKGSDMAESELAG